MALLGLGGRGLRERLIAQYGILPPGSIGQTLFDEIIPVVVVDDLTQGLILDQFYRAPAAGRTAQAAVALEFSFSSIQAAAASMILVERVEYLMGSGGEVRLRTGTTGDPIGAPTKMWRDRRVQGSPTAVVSQGTETGALGDVAVSSQGVATEFRSIDLQMVLSPSNDVDVSTVSLWNTTVNELLFVNWFWREILIP